MTDPETFDAEAHEQAKKPEDRAADVAYTVNHAISCGATDVFVQPFASAAVVTAAQRGKLPKSLHWLQKIFEHNHLEEGPVWKQLFGNLKHWAFGEVVGDVGGIVPTVLTQRFAPGMMHGMRNALEPIAGGAFRQGAHRDAIHWATKHGYADDSPQAKHKEAELYEHEMAHLPQAVMWNVYSIPINYGAQRWLFKHSHGGHGHGHDHGHHHHHTLGVGEFVVGKTFGSLLSNTALIGGRAMFPEKFNEWDRANSDHVIRPVMKTFGGVFGYSDKDIDRMEKKEQERRDGGGWKGRVEKQQEEAEAAVSVRG